jgi:hypothetical protein
VGLGVVFVRGYRNTVLTPTRHADDESKGTRANAVVWMNLGEDLQAQAGERRG